MPRELSLRRRRRRPGAVTVMFFHASLTYTTLDSTEKEIAAVHAANADDVDKAVRAAHAALANPEWKQMPAARRGLLMYKLAERIEQQQEIFATSEAWDNGTLPSELLISARSF
ncbi:aldehyde dehydrogenase [Ilyonectria robusta]